MIFFALQILFCTSATDCHWRNVDVFVEQEECQEAAETYLYELRPDGAQRARCVVEMREH